MKRSNLKGFLLGLTIGIVVMMIAVSGVLFDRYVGLGFLDNLIKGQPAFRVDQKVVNEESVVVDVAKNVSPSVVTVSINTPQQSVLEFSPFGGFQQRVQGGEPQDIGSGFIVDANGLIVTNKHVVSDTSATYKVVTNDGKEYDVKSISRDPANDIAILKIDATGLKPIELGDSSNIQVGQFAIAIGTALGEFRNTVTTGVISGIGRGIQAGSVFQGYVEKLDDVIQTDAAINPGNSGGPLLNSSGQVIGINVAVAQGAQNIGFAIPINIVKSGLQEFQANGKFASKAYLGVEYQMISQRTAVMNQVPQGAYIVNVVSGSPAEKAGLQPDDIVTKFDGVDLKGDTNGLADLITKRKPGDSVTMDVWRNGQTQTLSATLSESAQ